MSRLARAVHAVVALGMLSLLTSGCYTTIVRNGKPASPPHVAFDERWHHGLLWGIAEISGPYDLSQACPDGWAEIKTETSFLNGLLSALTWNVYSSQTVTVRCSAFPPPGSVATAEQHAPAAPAPSTTVPATAPSASESASSAPTPVETPKQP